MPRSRSIFIQSDCVRRAWPRARTAPAARMAPPASSRFSVRVVLPASGGLMIAKGRRRGGAGGLVIGKVRRRAASRAREVLIPGGLAPRGRLVTLCRFIDALEQGLGGF